MKKTLLFVPFFILLEILSCSPPKILVYQDFKNFRIEKLGFSNSNIKMNLKYFNPNNFGVQLKSSDLDIFINNSFLGHSFLDTLINIPRRDTFLLPINFTVDMQRFFKNAWNTFTHEEILVKVTGKLKIGKANIFMNVPVNYEGKHQFSLFK